MWFKNYKIAQIFGELGMIDKTVLKNLIPNKKMKKIMIFLIVCTTVLTFLKIFIVKKALKLTFKTSFPLDEIKLCEPKFTKRKFKSNITKVNRLRFLLEIELQLKNIEQVFLTLGDFFENELQSIVSRLKKLQYDLPVKSLRWFFMLVDFAWKKKKKEKKTEKN